MYCKKHNITVGTHECPKCEPEKKEETEDETEDEDEDNEK